MKYTRHPLWFRAHIKLYISPFVAKHTEAKKTARHDRRLKIKEFEKKLIHCKNFVFRTMLRLTGSLNTTSLYFFGVFTIKKMQKCSY